MARLVATSSQLIFERVLRNWREAGLREGFKFRKGSLYVATALKRSIDHSNAIQRGECWIAAVGTYFTEDGLLGAQALASCLREKQSPSPSSVQAHLLGHYSAAVFDGNRLSLFTDPAGVSELHFRIYRTPSRDFLAGNFASDFFVEENAPKIDDVRAVLFAKNGVRGHGRGGVIPESQTLQPQDVISTSASDGILNVHRKALAQPLPMVPDTLERAVEEGQRLADRIFAALGRIGPYAISCTGGLDSRLIAAQARRHGAKPDLLYGRGDTRMTNTRDQDLEIVCRIGREFDWPTKILDWRSQAFPDRAERMARHLTFGLHQPYGSTPSVWETMADISEDTKVVLSGYTSAFTNLKPWEWTEKELTLESFAQRAISGELNFLKDPREREAHLSAAIEGFREIMTSFGVGGPDGVVSEELYTLLYAARHQSRIINVVALNQFFYFLAPFSIAPLCHYLGMIPPRMRRGDRYQLELIRHAEPRLLDFPIFSGLREFRFDLDKMVMSAVAENRSVPARAFEKALGLANAFLLKLDKRDRNLLGPLRSSLGSVGSDVVVDLDRLASGDPRVGYRYLSAMELALAFQERSQVSRREE